MEPDFASKTSLTDLMNVSPILVPDLNYHKISIAPMLVLLFPKFGLKICLN